MSDPCECLFSHEGLMRRLLSALREAQSDCTDMECTEPSGSGSSSSSGFDLTMMLALWGVAALMLFLTRPRSLRSSNRGDATTEKVQIQRRDDDNPPAPDVQ